MSSKKNRFTLGLAIGVSLGLVSSAGIVYASDITQVYSTITPVDTTLMNNVKSAVNDNNTRITGNTTSIGTLNTTVGEHTTSITSLNNSITTLGNTDTAIQTDVTNLKGNNLGVGAACVGNNTSDLMVRVGSICVDKYEASLWPDNTSAGTTPTLANDCLADGSNCAYVAQSRVGVIPTGSVSWLQATQACANAGKRLLSAGEWFMAAVGTVPANCNLGGTVANTGASATCTSRLNVVDMIGNRAEYIDYAQVIGTDGIPYAGYTGGNYTSTGATLVDRYFANFAVNNATDARVGFRCAR